jgi:hypothetical protein
MAISWKRWFSDLWEAAKSLLELDYSWGRGAVYTGPERIRRYASTQQLLESTDPVVGIDDGGSFTGFVVSEKEPFVSFWASGYTADDANHNVHDLAVEFWSQRGNGVDLEEKLMKMTGVVWDGRVGPFGQDPEKVAFTTTWKRGELWA